MVTDTNDEEILAAVQQQAIARLYRFRNEIEAFTWMDTADQITMITGIPDKDFEDFKKMAGDYMTSPTQQIKIAMVEYGLRVKR